MGDSIPWYYLYLICNMMSIPITLRDLRNTKQNAKLIAWTQGAKSQGESQIKMVY